MVLGGYRGVCRRGWQGCCECGDGDEVLAGESEVLAEVAAGDRPCRSFAAYPRGADLQYHRCLGRGVEKGFRVGLATGCAGTRIAGTRIDVWWPAGGGGDVVGVRVSVVGLGWLVWGGACRDSTAAGLTTLGYCH